MEEVRTYEPISETTKGKKNTHTDEMYMTSMRLYHSWPGGGCWESQDTGRHSIISSFQTKCLLDTLTCKLKLSSIQLIKGVRQCSISAVIGTVLHSIVLHSKTLPGFSFSKWRWWRCRLLLNTSGFLSTPKQQQAVPFTLFTELQTIHMSLNITAPTWSSEQKTAMTPQNLPGEVGTLILWCQN